MGLGFRVEGLGMRYLLVLSREYGKMVLYNFYITDSHIHYPEPVSLGHSAQPYMLPHGILGARTAPKP